MTKEELIARWKSTYIKMPQTRPAVLRQAVRGIIQIFLEELTQLEDEQALWAVRILATETVAMASRQAAETAAADWNELIKGKHKRTASVVKWTQSADEHLVNLIKHVGSLKEFE